MTSSRPDSDEVRLGGDKLLSHLRVLGVHWAAFKRDVFFSRVRTDYDGDIPFKF